MEGRIGKITDYWNDAFGEMPLEIGQFTGENLDRSTFMSLILQSHWTSEGSMRAQTLFALWYESKGIRVMDAVKACVDTGGWNSLSDDERREFIDAFNRVPEHSSRIDSDKLSRGEFFDRNLDFLLNDAQRVNSFELRGMSFEDMRNLQREAIARFQNGRALREELL